tara:strand:- start:2195 stop:2638 length:444 start_codon:yes stop_codon:yes gene_type:complete
MPTNIKSNFSCLITRYNKERSIKSLAIVFLIALSGCSSTSKNNNPTVTKKETQYITVTKEYTPQLWSHHKLLKETPELCATKGVSILNSLGFKSVVKNGNYVYGNFNNNRAAIKCIKINEQSFVYMAVAGPDPKLVEKLRNEISWKL